MSDAKQNQDGPAPVHLLVGQLLLEHIPEEGKLVIVHIVDDMTFCARLRLFGHNFPWPYWEIAGTNGERLRKANPHHDWWCYCPEIELPNAKDNRAQSAPVDHLVGPQS
jgi:hypothetical protein